MSAIPPLYEGTPFRADGHIITFSPVGTISVGNVVTLASTTGGSGFSVLATTSTGQFLLGVSLTTGGLAGGAFSTSAGSQGPTPIAVILRGIVDVVADATTVAIGDYLVPSATTGAVHSIGSNAVSNAGVVRAVALTPSTTNGTVIQAYLF